MRVKGTAFGGGIAAQCNQACHTRIRVTAGNVQGFVPRCIHACQMGRHITPCVFVQNARGLLGQGTCCAPCAICHGHKAWVKRGKRVHRIPQAIGPFKILWWEKLKRNLGSGHYHIHKLSCHFVPDM